MKTNFEYNHYIQTVSSEKSINLRHGIVGTFHTISPTEKDLNNKDSLKNKDELTTNENILKIEKDQKRKGDIKKKMT